MNAVFNKVLVNVLGKYLQYYMNDFSKESFKLQILKGTFDLEDIEINCQFLKDTVVLPNLEITDCLCNKVFIYIPWHNISGEPIVIDLDTITMSLVEIPIGEQPIFQARKKRVKPSSYGFVQRTLDGIKMSVKHVNMSAKLNGYRGNPYMVKIKTSGINIYSAGPDWKPVDLKESFVADKTKSEVLFYKVLECSSMEFSFADLSPNRKNPDEPPEYATIMKDVPVKIRCKVLKDIKDGHVVCGAFDLVIDKMDMVFSDIQWKGFMELIKSLIGCFTRTDQEYTFYKDVGKAFEEENEISESDEEGSSSSSFSSSSSSSSFSSSSSSADREKKVPAKSKSWWSGWTESLNEKKVQREKERQTREKLKRLEILELKAKEREQLEAKGLDTSHLDLNETTFNVFIENGTMLMLNDDVYRSADPAYDAFGRLHFEGMKVVITLPPAMDVPDSNKWTASDPTRRLLCEANLEMRNMALVLQEDPKTLKERKKKRKKGQPKVRRKQVVLVTDGRSETLNKRIQKRKKRKKQDDEEEEEEEEEDEDFEDDEDEEAENGEGKGKEAKKERRARRKQAMKEFKERRKQEKKAIKERKEAAKAEQQQQGRSDAKKKAPAKARPVRPFCLVNWEVVTIAPQELDMAKWLKSLRCKMHIDVFQSNLLVLHRWWSRIVRFLETASVGSDNIQAVNLMRVYCELDVTENVMLVPMSGGNEMIVPDMEEIHASPHLQLYSTKIRGGKRTLGDVTELLKRAKIKDAFVPDEPEGDHPEKDKQVKIVGFGEGDDGWKSLQLLRKPQRFQLLLENMTLSIGDQRILSPIDFGIELTLHRYKHVEQMLMELCVHAQALQLHVSRAHYLMFLHFSKFVLTELWEEVVKVLLRKYGASSYQKELATMSYAELTRHLGAMPLVVNTHSFVDYMLLHLNGRKAPSNLAFLDECDEAADARVAPDGEAVMEMHFQGLTTSSCDTETHRTGVCDKRVNIAKLTSIAPPDDKKRQADIAKHEGQSAPPDEEDRGASRFAIATADGSVASSQFPVVRSLLSHHNKRAFTRLMEVGLGEEVRDVTTEAEPTSHGANVNSLELKVDDHPVDHMPTPLVAFLNDLFNL